MRRLFILPTEPVLRRFHLWEEAILPRLGYPLGSLVRLIVEPLLDEATRLGWHAVNDTDVTEIEFVGEIAFDALKELLTHGDFDEESDAYPPPEWVDIYPELYTEVHQITEALLIAVRHYVLLSLETRVEGYQPSTIMYQRMIGSDLVVAVDYRRLSFAL